MRNSGVLVRAVVACGLLFPVAPSFAAKGDCGQPVSTSSRPTVADIFAILWEAVGRASACDPEPCLCDVDGNGTIALSDAIRVLRGMVGQPVTLTCDCDDDIDPGCTSAAFTIADSDFDRGWTGLAHDGELLQGSGFSVRMKSVCSSTTSVECTRNDDCPGSETCEPTCNCNDDQSCELTGPAHEKHCRNDLETCDSDSDCDPDVPCVHLLGPPTPLSAGLIPVCAVLEFQEPISGSFDSGTGETRLSTSLRMRHYLGIDIDQPCPQCGTPDQDPAVGDQFTCTGGLRNGQACTVEGVSVLFGGASTDCPPAPESNISSAGLAIRLGELTTDTATTTARLPCKFFGFTGNPTVPGSNPKCLDKLAAGDPVCASNADCRRCTEDIETSCASNGDCTGKGLCGEAPDQPVTCGFWCSCGFCNNDPALPCFETSDCPEGQACQMGTGTGTQPNLPQQRPNDCSDDGFLCGGEADEQCAKTQKATCSEQPYLLCDSNADCAGAGVCHSEARPCFESRITRSGEASPLGKYCAFENRTCDTNADCTTSGDFCAADAARPETVALLCMPATANAAVNATTGITGPGALRLGNFVQVCRCGDGVVGCDEECDDANVTNGDGCDQVCRDE